MMPDDELSAEPVPSVFLSPDDRAFNTLRDYEYGGIANQDASEGLLYQIWTAWIDDSGVIRVQPENGSQPAIEVTTQLGAEYISLAFDRNMNMAVAWSLDGAASLYWFDSIVEGFITSTFENCTCPRLTHDDKRDGAGTWSDVIFAYMRDGNLYYRQQRDRYAIERLLSENLIRDLTKLGMNNGLRLQFEV